MAHYSHKLYAKTNEEQGNVSTIAIENNNETTTDTKEYVGEKQPVFQANSVWYLAHKYPQGPIPLPMSILKNHTTTEPTFKVSSAVTAMGKASHDVKIAFADQQ